jgi:uncharacterized protein (DUF2384 family)
MIRLNYQGVLKIDKSKQVTGLKTVFNILDKWGYSPEQQILILGMKKSLYDDCRKDINKTSLSDDQLKRVSYILNIHAALRMLFDHPENMNGFMSMNNHNAFFDGRKPIDIISSGRLDDLSDTFKHIDSLVIRQMN